MSLIRLLSKPSVFIRSALLLLIALLAAGTVGASEGPVSADLESACNAGAPYYFAVTQCSPFNGTIIEDAPSIVLFENTPRDTPHYRVASIGEIGTLWGLAYARRTHTLYAGAFHKRQLPFGPGGPGAIYRINIDSGEIELALTVPDAGPDHHVITRLGLDAKSAVPAGRTSLGDIELSEDETRLFVMNLFDRHVYHFRLSDGALLNRFPHGAVDEPWSGDARPFGLGVRDGLLYHGVVNSAESTNRKGELLAQVYRSRPDGGEMTQVAEFPLFGQRGIIRGSSITKGSNIPVQWLPWKDGWIPPPPSGGAIVTALLNPMPLLSDIDFDDDGNMLAGFRDRFADSTPMYRRGDDVRHVPGAPFGDLLRGTPDGDGWYFDLFEEPYDDETVTSAYSSRERIEESAHGGVAFEPASGRVASTAFVHPEEKHRGGLAIGMAIYDPREGSLEGQESLCAFDRPFGRIEDLRPRAGDGPSPLGGRTIRLNLPNGDITGDLESTCIESAAPTPTSAPTNTPSAVPTDTATTIPSATPSRTPSREPTATLTSSNVYLPVAIHDQGCSPTTRSADIVLVLDASTSMEAATVAGRSKLEAAQEAARAFVELLGDDDRVGIVAFNSVATRLADLTGDRDRMFAAIERIETAEFTQIHLGLAEAIEVIDLPGRDAERSAVIVLLTDGRSNPEPVSEALDVADVARASGVHVFTIGLGADVETAALRSMASSPSDSFFAPDGEDLLDIYQRIAGAIPCPRSASWPYEH